MGTRWNASLPGSILGAGLPACEEIAGSTSVAAEPASAGRPMALRTRHAGQGSPGALAGSRAPHTSQMGWAGMFGEVLQGGAVCRARSAALISAQVGALQTSRLRESTMVL